MFSVVLNRPGYLMQIATLLAQKQAESKSPDSLPLQTWRLVGIFLESLGLLMAVQTYMSSSSQ